MDKLDRNILESLQRNGRMTTAELAERVGMSRTPVFERVKKLERQGVIQKYVALVDPHQIGITCFTFVEVQLIRHGRETVNRFIAEIKKIPEVMECHHITGEADFLLKVATKDIPTYEHLLLNTMTALPDVRNLKTLVVLSTLVKKTQYPV
ncbi:MAG: Lrp/AsnC family transcriptional regulator [FCB group bacterium]|nr:Lrp/AsnC family transcriptional regulator [FCB group bacterium]